MFVENCLFCDNSEKHEIILENRLFYSRWDKFPVSEGHALVILKRHIISLFELTLDELVWMYDLLCRTKEVINQRFSPDGYNIGVNEGQAAGRTVNHLHIHLIPRYKGDVENPRGGVRNIIPGKGNY